MHQKVANNQHGCNVLNFYQLGPNYFSLNSKVFYNEEYVITFHIQPQNHFLPFYLCPIETTLTYSVQIFCGVTFPFNQKQLYVT